MYTSTSGMYANYEVEANKQVYTEKDKNNSMSGVCFSPIYECPQERIIHREICHEVPQV